MIASCPVGDINAESFFNIIDCLKLNGRNGWVDTSVTFYKNKIIHLGSSYVFEQFCSQLKPGHNHYVVNFFHGRYGRDNFDIYD